MRPSEVLRRAQLKLQQREITRHSIGVAIIEAGKEAGMEMAAHAFGILAMMLNESIVDWSVGRSLGDIDRILERAIALAKQEEK